MYCVIDAGALLELLLRTMRAKSVQAAVDDRQLIAPAVIDAEVLSGLRGLEDRVAALDGTLELDSPPGRGTRLRAQIPVSRFARRDASDDRGRRRAARA